MDTILIVDDDPGMLLLIKTILDGKGHRLLTASDGIGAQALIEKEGGRITTILLDWEMPRMSGIELLRWIKEQPEVEHIPVIMQTAMDSPEQIKEGIDAGAFYYLTKPFDQNVLQSIVTAALTDFRYKKSLVKKLRESENPFELLVEGTFHFRTLSEGERMALWIANACPSPGNAMEISEIITNAVEHGNLGITYDEKTAYVSQGTWQAEITQRLALPENSGKDVKIQIKKYPNKLAVLIEDEGSGFDYKRYLAMDESRAFHNHGRGIAMASSWLDLEYLGNGNKVLVTIPFE